MSADDDDHDGSHGTFKGRVKKPRKRRHDDRLGGECGIHTYVGQGFAMLIRRLIVSFSPSPHPDTGTDPQSGDGLWRLIRYVSFLES